LHSPHLVGLTGAQGANHEQKTLYGCRCVCGGSLRTNRYAAAGRAKAARPGKSRAGHWILLQHKKRVSHKQLTEKLVAVRTETIETPKGYEFQFSPNAGYILFAPHVYGDKSRRANSGAFRNRALVETLLCQG
jgi:hypothetical protein